MRDFDNNRFDLDFARRMIIAGVLSGIAMLLVGTALASPLVSFLGLVAGTFVLMIIEMTVIAMMADYLRLAPFPLLAVILEKKPLQGERLFDSLRKTGYALPLSFTAASLWLIMAAESFGEHAPALSMLLLAPLTIGLLILHTDCDTPLAALNRSAKTFGIVLLAALLLVPEYEFSGTAGATAESAPSR